MFAYAFAAFLAFLFLGIAVQGAFLYGAALLFVLGVGAAVVGFILTLTGRIDPFRFLDR